MYMNIGEATTVKKSFYSLVSISGVSDNVRQMKRENLVLNWTISGTLSST